MKFVIHSRKYGNHTVIIDDEDAEEVLKHTWYVQHEKRIGRIRFIATKKKIAINKYSFTTLHHFITGSNYIDHVNGNVFDNRKKNLRKATASQNNCNRSKPKNNTSGYKGVTWRERLKKWEASININKKYYYLGAFKDKEEAAKAYNKLAKKLHGEFARLNSIKIVGTI